MEWVFLHAPGLGKSWGLPAPAPQLGGIVFDSPSSFYYIILLTAVILTALAKNLVRTRAGRAFIAIRDNDIAAEIMGINLTRYKLLAFAIAAFYAGISGSLWGHYAGHVTPDRFIIWESIWYLGIIIVGGLGSIAGSVFGTAFMQLLREGVVVVSPVISQIFPALGAVMSAALGLLFLGLVIIGFLIFEPRGLARRWEILKSYYRLSPFAH